MRRVSEMGQLEMILWFVYDMPNCLSAHTKICSPYHNRLHSPTADPETDTVKFKGSFLPAGACAARKRLALRLLYVFHVCLFVCLYYTVAALLT